MKLNGHGVDLDLLMKPFPAACIKERDGGGGRRFSYVPGHVVKRRLIEATGNNYDLAILSDSKTEVTGKPGDFLVEVRVALTIPGCGTREGIGVQIVAARAGEDLLKGALTDAIKNAAVLFGIGLDLYGGDLEKEATCLSADEAKAKRNRFVNDARRIYGQKIESAQEAQALFASLTGGQALPGEGDDKDEASALYEEAFRALDARVHEAGEGK